MCILTGSIVSSIDPLLSTQVLFRDDGSKTDLFYHTTRKVPVLVHYQLIPHFDPAREASLSVPSSELHTSAEQCEESSPWRQEKDLEQLYPIDLHPKLQHPTRSLIPVPERSNGSSRFLTKGNLGLQWLHLRGPTRDYYE
jgi:hypothetical protein